MRATFRLEPLAQFFQVTPDSAELPRHRLCVVFCRSGHDTDRQEFLADINAAHRSITAGIIGASSR